MRSHAKASTAGSRKTRRAALPIGAFAAILAALALVAALASAAVPTATTGSATEIQKTTATLNGTVNPQGALLEECKFEWGTTTSYGQVQACDLTPAEIGEGTSAVAVKAEITGLTEATTYHFRLVAKNSEGTSNGSDATFKTLSPPVVKERWAASVLFNEATLKAKINPEGFATSFHVDYGPTTAYGASTPETSVGSDNADHVVSATIGSLTPGTTYHYRVVATSSIGTSESADTVFNTYRQPVQDIACPNQSYRTGSAALLSDCRAYEMVSPIDKNNGDILEGTKTTGLSSSDGNGLTYAATASFGDAPSAPILSQYLSTRGGGGWSTHAISAPRSYIISTGGLAPLFTEFKAFTPDLSAGVLYHQSAPLTPDGLDKYPDLYIRNNLTDEYRSLVDTKPPQENIRFWPEPQAVTPDLDHVVFASEETLTPDAPSYVQDRDILYEWVGGQLRLVSVLPNGEPTTGAASAGTRNGPNRVGTEHSVENAISRDGSRIFWSAGGGFEPSEVYVRINGETTEPVSDPGTSAVSRFWTADKDGSKAIFSESASYGDLSGEGVDLYEFDVNSETRTLIAHRARGVVAASDDLSYLYFISREVLDSGATDGASNLYLRHNGAVTFIATVSESDGDANIGDTIQKTGSLTSYIMPSRRSAVTPDGRHLAFAANAKLTSYDNADADSGAQVAEVYLYDADSGQLSCPSCNPSGARPQSAEGIAGLVRGWRTQLIRRHPLSLDGKRLFFESSDALLPWDTNGQLDVYEWEAAGSGSCETAETAGGCISLISSGKSARVSEFVDAGQNGRDVFFGTNSSLLSQDPGLIDIYDAREFGGFPPPPPPPTPCVGDACQNPAEAPRAATPTSAGFHGAGNPEPASGGACGRQAKQARALSRRAKRLRRAARHARGGARAKVLRRRAKRMARAARQRSKRASRCRKRARGAGR